jgi:hypothetical protein
MQTVSTSINEAFKKAKVFNAARTAKLEDPNQWVYNSRSELFNLIAYTILYIEDSLYYNQSYNTLSTYKGARANKQDSYADRILPEIITKEAKMIAGAFSGVKDAYEILYKLNNAKKTVDIYIKTNVENSLTYETLISFYSKHYSNIFKRVTLSPTGTRSEDEGNGSFNKINPNFSFESKGFQPLDQLKSIAKNVEFDSNGIITSKGTAPLPEKPSDPRIWKALSFSFDFNETTTRASESKAYSNVQKEDNKSNTVPLTPTTLINFVFDITLKLSLPIETVQWMTSSPDAKSISFPDLNALLKAYLTSNFVTSKRGGDKCIKQIMPLTTSLDYLKDIKSKSIVKIEPRTYKNMTVLANGQFIFVPPYENVDEYVKLYNDTYDIQTGKVSPIKEIPELRNKFLLADWYHNAYLYTNSEGSINTVDLTGAMKPSRSMLFRGMNIKNFSHGFTSSINEFCSVGSTICAAFDLYDSALNKLGLGDITTDIAYMYKNDFVKLAVDLLKEWMESGLSIHQFFNIGNPEMIADMKEALGENSNSADYYTHPVFVNRVKYFVTLCSSIVSVINKKPISTVTFSTLVYSYYSYVIFGVLCNNFTEYKKAEAAYEADVKRNKVTHLPYDKAVKESFTIPNMPGLKGYLPHQTQIVSNIFDRYPKYTILSVGAGGGKTTMFLSQVLKEMESGISKRALILCPKSLIKSWINEINKFSGGYLNAFPLNHATVSKKLVNILGLDTEEKLVNFISKQPINTIFITDFNTLSVSSFFKNVEGGKSNVQYSDKVFTFYPNAHFFAQLGFDRIVVDESHKIKNIATARSAAARTVISYINRRTIGSGTILHNKVDDLIGQVALLNPGLLGDVKDIIGPDSNVISPEKKLKELMTPFVSDNIAVRRDWSFLIPPVHYNYISASMTQNQAAYYASMVDKALAELLQDPKIKLVLESGDQEKIDKLTSKLDTVFSTVEIFMNAPTTQELFVNSSTTTKEDLVSPKSVILNKVIEAHFNGGDVIDADGLKTSFNKSKHKILVFCYNRAVSLALFNGLDPKYKSKFVHYTATSEGEKNLIRFTQDDDVWGMVADETGISEGHNLQMASHLVRIQALWTPGAEEQSMSRVLRPDIGDKYARDRIDLTTIICNSSLDVPKTARVLAKKIAVTKASEASRADWIKYMSERNVPNLPLIKMNLQLLKKYTQGLRDVSIDTLISENQTKFTLADYFSAYRHMVQWQDKQGRENTIQLRDAVAAKLGQPVEQTTLKDIRKNCAAVVDGSSVLLSGSKYAYTPFVPGISIIPDKLGLQLSALAVIKIAGTDENGEAIDEDDSDDDDDDLIENTTYDVGDMVVTEFGFGFITNISDKRKNVVSVNIPGFRNGKITQINKTECFKPLNEEMYERIKKRLEKLENSGKGILFPNGIAALTEEKLFSKIGKPSTFVVEEPPVKPIKMPEINPADHPASDEGKKDVVKVTKPTKVEDDNTQEGVADKPTSKPTSKPTAKPVTPVKPTKVINVDDDTDDGNLKLANQVDNKTKENIKQSMIKKGLLFHYAPSTGVSAVVDVAIINGMISLATYPIEGHFDKLQQASGVNWDKIQTFGFIKIKTYQGALNMVDTLESKFILPANTGKMIKNLAKGLRTHSKAVMQEEPISFTGLKNFIRIMHTDTEGGDQLKVYPIIWNGFLYVAALQRIQPRTFNQFTKLNVSGCDKPQINTPTSAYIFVRNKNAALKELERINSRIHVINYDDIVNELKTDPDYRNLVG